MVDLYAALGVDPESSIEEIKSAYRRLAFDNHPDRHVGASPEEIDRLTAKMTEAVQAYEVLSDQSLRAAYDDRRLGRGYRGPEVDRPRDPGPGECMICGWGPARQIQLHQGVGMILRRQKSVMGGMLCKFCAKSMFRMVQNSTMIKGWWGVIAFFANIGYILHNLTVLSDIRSLPAPVPPPAPLNTPLPFPMPPGRPLLARAGVWISILAITAACSLAFGRHHITPGGASQPAISVGMCVDGTAKSIGDPVDCSSTHFAKIVGIVSKQSDCPIDSDGASKETRNGPQPGKFVCLKLMS